ncbi:hypothetical protein [Streptomyces sp. MZ04]|uniref:hypothetical protein n=1 Tax=Streptomyces sp. MZ04 TaxID=2559236 RepID=UPI00107EE4F4|nr:hypothetical protein [Streptomyces sp. MZ04]TGB06551.1 hypothetical protein E2651_23360 [Streptomyces sp. MZ04]
MCKLSWRDILGCVGLAALAGCSAAVLEHFHVSQIVIAVICFAMVVAGGMLVIRLTLSAIARERDAFLRAEEHRVQQEPEVS